MSTPLGDVRLGLRSMVRAPLATALALACLALGIGANASMFSVVSAGVGGANLTISVKNVNLPRWRRPVLVEVPNRQ